MGDIRNDMDHWFENHAMLVAYDLINVNHIFGILLGINLNSHEARSNLSKLIKINSLINY